MAPGLISVVLVPVPEADALVKPWTRPRGLGAHVTLAAPFLDPARIDDDTVVRLSQCLHGAARSRVVFDEVGSFSDTVIYLAPREPGCLVDLARRVGAAFPEVPAPARPYVAHLTVATRRSRGDLVRAAEAAARAVPITAEVREVRLVAQRRPSGWEERARIDLGG
jgi:2'-5' RNA ligase